MFDAAAAAAAAAGEAGQIAGSSAPLRELASLLTLLMAPPAALMAWQLSAGGVGVQEAGEGTQQALRRNTLPTLVCALAPLVVVVTYAGRSLFHASDLARRAAGLGARAPASSHSRSFARHAQVGLWVWCLGFFLCYSTQAAASAVAASLPPSAGDPASAFFWGVHLVLAPLAWLACRVPLRLAIAPDLLRQVGFAKWALSIAPAAALPRAAALLATRCAASSAATCLLLSLCAQPHGAALQPLFDAAATCPRVASRLLSAVERCGAFLKSTLFDDVPLMDANARALLLLWALRCAAVAAAGDGGGAPAERALAFASSVSCGVAAVLAASASAKAAPRSTQSARSDAASSAAAERAKIFALLRDRFAVASTEAEILRAGCDAAASLWPRAVACAFGAVDTVDATLLTALEVFGSERSKAALRAALVPSVCTPGSGSSVAAACGDGGGGGDGGSGVSSPASGVAGSLSPVGDDSLAAFSDWAAARDAGLGAAHAFTAPLRLVTALEGGHVGFFSLFHGPPAGRAAAPHIDAAVLNMLTDAGKRVYLPTHLSPSFDSPLQSAAPSLCAACSRSTAWATPSPAAPDSPAAAAPSPAAAAAAPLAATRLRAPPAPAGWWAASRGARCGPPPRAWTCRRCSRRATRRCSRRWTARWRRTATRCSGGRWTRGSCPWRSSSASCPPVRPLRARSIWMPALFPTAR